VAADALCERLCAQPAIGKCAAVPINAKIANGPVMVLVGLSEMEQERHKKRALACIKD
jgi:hypothetical protein